ncbi:5-oxoprolinase subunit PxpA [Microbacterium hominis]|uniref:LamB/YcsF family protein n=1 Tax=Microbacterium hominis TaxID=162426 RepID=A0A7D4QGR6_9MICO|nr:5-oxoprolinase subunit PxpA [Microbacterium hominis]QKJ18456.1 LamB/YcsF family protein [Microbacterium hominis]
MATIDLNADLGETVGGVPTADDEAMFAVISSASIACGGHAGDAASMRAAAERARRFGVSVGAHPSYADPANFGRIARDLPPASLRAMLEVQLQSLIAAGADVRYVKPHGALYNRIVHDAAQADAVADAIASLASRLGRPLPVLGLGGAIAAAAGDRGLPFVREAFLDRGYLPDGTLVPRSRPGALLDDPDAVAARAVRLVRAGTVTAVDGSEVEVDAASLCVHGDSPAAVAMARAVRAALDAAAVEVRSPW